MADAVVSATRPRPGLHPGRVAAALYLPALLASLSVLMQELPLQFWRQALFDPDFEDVRQLLFRYSHLPRICVALLAGGSLGLAGAVFQQVLRNPLAEPTTLGVSAGASTALVAVTLWAPSLLARGQELVALAGALLAAMLVFALAWKKALSPLSLILAGLVVSLYSGAFASVVTFFHYERLTGIFLWSSGALNQNDWSVAGFLLPRFAVAGIAIWMLSRQLEILSLTDESARSLGLALASCRLLAMGLGVALSAFVVSAVGVIGFVGLAAPALARLSGARRVKARLLWSAIMGAGLLWLTDQLAQHLGGAIREIPTGIATAFLGAPLLLWLVNDVRRRETDVLHAEPPAVRRLDRPVIALSVIALALVLAAVLAFCVGRNGSGWHWDTPDEVVALVQWRVPRMAAALAAGAMLSAAGVLMQRLTGNPMAGPEVLGISSGAGLGLILSLLIGGGTGLLPHLAPAAAGALAVLGVLLFLGQRAGFLPERMLLIGIAIGTVFSAAAALAIASGDPRMQMLMGWMTGSTYYVTYTDALAACVLAVVLIPAAALCHRWLAILPLGEGTGRALGLRLACSRFTIVVLASGLTAAATLVVGPLSFVGLMAPHMARMIGLRRSVHELAGAALIGAAILVLADFAGRNLLFPYQIPAGLLATFIGGPYFMWLMRR